MRAAAARPVFLINSGAYVPQELSAEFGFLPPAFMPVGLGRLYELQAATLGADGGDLYMSLPESFELSIWDAKRLDELGVTIVWTVDGLSLGSALLHALGRLPSTDRPLRILHGDTLVSGIDFGSDDFVAVAHGSDGYRWGAVELDADGRVSVFSHAERPGRSLAGPRLCGYFAFGSAARVVEMLSFARGDFIEALNALIAETGLLPVEPERWLDFGHVQTFFRSRRIVTTERAFNTLEISDTRVRKRSATAPAKLKAEARWLQEVPAEVAPYCARLLAEGEDDAGYFYDTEYEYMPTMAELYVFGRASRGAWTRMLTACGDFVAASRIAATGRTVPGRLAGLVIEKTADRLEAVGMQMGIDLKAGNTLNGRPAASLRRCLDDIEAALHGCGNVPSIMHGDFCFANILYSFRRDRVRLIDPRGLNESGEFELVGDLRYDLAKLMHSVFGRYDLIMAGHHTGGRTGAHAFELTFPAEPWRLDVEADARSLVMGGVRLDSRVVWASMMSLFLSMPPLHVDRPERQAAFIANALRLHASMGETV